ncbi:hypothetical protein [Pseudofulvimonas gallinarii]|uniref:hypothetical protein n=1 Tax=Pseudofulvimonas gallinarii TaxID=634155 RepID=UPI0035E7FDF7
MYVTQEGNEGFAIQPELIARYFIRDDLNVRLQFFPRWSQDWLIWREDTLFASYRRKQQRLDLDVNWFPGSRTNCASRRSGWASTPTIPPPTGSVPVAACSKAATACPPSPATPSACSCATATNSRRSANSTSSTPAAATHRVRGRTPSR